MDFFGIYWRLKHIFDNIKVKLLKSQNDTFLTTVAIHIMGRVLLSSLGKKVGLGLLSFMFDSLLLHRSVICVSAWYSVLVKKDTR